MCDFSAVWPWPVSFLDCVVRDARRKSATPISGMQYEAAILPRNQVFRVSRASEAFAERLSGFVSGGEWAGVA